MGKSGRVRLADLGRAYRLVHDCRDVGGDPDGWAPVLAEGMRTLIDAPLVLIGKVFLTGVRPRLVFLADRGWATSAHRAAWQRRFVVEEDYDGLETYHRFLAIPARLKTRSRGQLIADAEWYRSFEFNEVQRPIGIDDLVASAGLTDADPSGPVLFSFVGFRPPGDPPIPARQRRLVRLFHAELTRHLGRSIVLDPADPFAGLQPRLRRTLDSLLEGDGEKQVAARLGLSRNTVHEYVKALHRHFDVSSRAELMALCHRLAAPRIPG
jgi:DNA-binding CsgD family transcriptional regulator